MRLRQIKISGFKSFADTTVIDLERPVIGIVGPNGCGKSNIIDAVRWVLGEARVAELRGSNSMKELIFAGSTSRRPLGRASVELLLTNDDGSIKGPFGDYAEISVKRVMTADGASTYFINTQKVRRRDVQDIFLGTGLGPRSYAIISQGMISNFIKAKPEEMRVYLEEAAGVSIYRERRRETESLLTQTRHNLERVQDLQTVKAEEIERLETEAELARHWKALDEKKRHAETQWYFIQHEDARRDVDALNAKIAVDEAALEEHKADLVKREAGLPAVEAQVQAAEAADRTAAAALRDAERQLATFEGERRRRIEMREAAEQVIEETAQAIDEKTRARDAAAASVKALQAEKDGLDEKLALLDEETAAREEGLFDEEDRLNDQRDATRKAESDLAAARTAESLARGRVGEFERRRDALKQRLVRLDDTARTWEVPDPKRLDALRESLDAAQAVEEETTASLETLRLDIEDAQAERESANEAYFALLSREKETAARLDTLESIQRKADEAGRQGEFETEAGLNDLERIAAHLEVADAWVGAVEAQLQHRANGVLLRMIDIAGAFETNRPPAPLSFVDSRARRADREAAARPLVINGVTYPALLSVVRGKMESVDAALCQWLSRRYCIESVKDALKLRTELPDDVLLVTPAGDTVSAAGVDFWTPTDPSFNRLSRQREIEAVQTALDAIEDELGIKDKARTRAQQRVTELNARLSDLTIRERDCRKETAALRVQVGTVEQKVLAHEQRCRDMARDRDDLLVEAETVEAQLEEAEIKAEEAQEAQTRVERFCVGQQRALTLAQEKFKTVSDGVQASRRELDRLRMRAEQITQAEGLNANQARMLDKDIERENVRRASAQAALKRLEDTSDDVVLDRALSTFKAAEAKAGETTRTLEALRETLTALSRELREKQTAVMPMSEALSQLRADRQIKDNLRAQFADVLEGFTFDRAAMAADLLEHPVKANTVKAQVTRLINEMAALGPVNHAALDHLDASRRAMEATAAQVADLETAIGTLEAAIRKIDTETRDRMQETFDQVRVHFDETFRDLFGGGLADLVMVGDDILSAGVEVRAQPPGKRNASIKLLSGGEQALTATALVLALFKLNPAPFCLLDEVDAPLDEANQSRLAGLCHRMSEKTLFLMITHHRVTMEYADALIGVTMKEPGVSRVVSVDVEEAAKMVD